MDEKWYVVQVFSGQEFIIKGLCDKALLNEGEEIFIPQYERKKKFKKVWEIRRNILFPGYVFFNTPDVIDMFLRLKIISRLTKILRSDDQFIPLDEDDVNFIKKSGGDDHVFEMSYGYVIGDDVLITDGPMVNMEGRIKRIDRHRRIAVIEVKFMGRMTDITVGLEITKKIPADNTIINNS